MTIRNRRLSSLLLAFVLVFSLAFSLAVPASAASKSEKITSSDKAFGNKSWRKMEDITVKTGSGLFYRFGWKKTTMTIRNTGSQTLNLYAREWYGLHWLGSIGPGRAKTFSLSGNGQIYQYIVQGGSYQNRNYGSFQVNTSAGYIW